MNPHLASSKACVLSTLPVVFLLSHSPFSVATKTRVEKTGILLRNRVGEVAASNGIQGVSYGSVCPWQLAELDFS